MNQDGPKDQNNELNNLPDWLRQMAGAEETPDWLLRLSLESEEIPGAAVSPAVQPYESEEPAFAGQDMPDWFGDDQIAPSEQQEQQEPEKVPDWFQGIAGLDRMPRHGLVDLKGLAQLFEIQQGVGDAKARPPMGGYAAHHHQIVFERLFVFVRMVEVGKRCLVIKIYKDCF